MIITCDKCSTSFNLDESLLSPEGSKVRCSVCRNIFTARPQTVEPSAGTDEEFPADLSTPEPDQEIESIPEESSSFEVEEEDFSLEDTDLEMEEADLEMEEADLGEDDDFSFEDDSEIDEGAGSDESVLEEDTAIEFDDDLILEKEDEETSLEFDYNDDDGLEFETIDDGDDDLILENDAVPLEEDDDLSLDMEEMTSQEKPEEPDEESGDEDLALEDEEEFELDFDVQDNDEDISPSPAPEPGISEENPDESPDTDSKTEKDSASSENTASEEDAHDSSVITPEDDFSQYDEILEQETEPEFEISEDDASESKETEDKKFPQQAKDTEDTHTPLITPPSGATRRRKKKSAISAPVLILVLAFFLVTGAYVASKMTGYKIPYLSDLNITFIDQYLKKPAIPAPALKPVPNQKSVNGRFVTNSTAGTLFVITGRVKNPSDTAYSYIEVKGALITKGKKQARTKTAFCGNILTEEMLKNSNIADINKKLSVKSGNHNSNINIKPGASVPFMIVFSNLPEKLQNFTVKVVGFKKGEKK
jgi:predicted Zn finger-like uncharacterized protein